MNQFEKYLLNQAYEKVARLGDRLAKIDKAVNWENFRPIIRAMYTNNTLLGGRPNTDEVLIMKLLVLKQWYGLSDMELERQAAYRLNFQNFLGWPERRALSSDEPLIGLFPVHCLEMCLIDLKVFSIIHNSLFFINYQ